MLLHTPRLRFHSHKVGGAKDGTASAGTAWSCGAVWSARRPVKPEVAGSNPVRTATVARPEKWDRWCTVG